MPASCRSSQCGFEQGRNFKNNMCVQRWDADTLKRGLVLRVFDNGTGVRGAIILVMLGRGISLRMAATGQEFEIGDGFQQQTM